MEWSLFGWRDVILLLVVAMAIYLVVMVLKLSRIRRPHTSHVSPAVKSPKATPPGGMDLLLEPHSSAQSPRAQEAALSAYAEAMAETAPPPERYATPPTPTFEWDDVKELFGEAQAAAPAAAEPRRGGFGEHLADHLARSDMEMEMQRMRDEMARMHREMEEMRASRRVSPQYAEAMELSQRGLTAQDVADRLGISLAEAELVQALARGRQNFD